MWIAKCCKKNTGASINSLMRNTIKLYIQDLKSSVSSGTQNNTYLPNLVRTKRCHIIDRSLAAQDTAISGGIRDTSIVKEFIFEYFDTTGLKFNEIKWSDNRFKVLTPPTKQATVKLDGRLYIGSDDNPFISVIAGLIK